jgi:hypothetical protein
MLDCGGRPAGLGYGGSLAAISRNKRFLKAWGRFRMRLGYFDFRSETNCSTTALRPVLGSAVTGSG